VPGRVGNKGDHHLKNARNCCASVRELPNIFLPVMQECRPAKILYRSAISQPERTGLGCAAVQLPMPFPPGRPAGPVTA